MPACVSMAVSVSVCEHVGIGVGGGGHHPTVATERAVAPS